MPNADLIPRLHQAFARAFPGCKVDLADVAHDDRSDPSSGASLAARIHWTGFAPFDFDARRQLAMAVARPYLADGLLAELRIERAAT